MKKHSLVCCTTAHLFLAILSIALVSCEKVIDVDLNSSSPQIVIEGAITDGPGPYVVMLTQTVNFDETNVFPPVTSATIALRDDLGNSESLMESSPGMYRTSTIRGIPGRKYTLTVSANGKEYTASSTMPAPVSIDSLSVRTQSFAKNQQKVINVHFEDPAEVKNYYRFVEVRNGIKQKFIFLDDDRAQDGNSVTSALLADNDTLRTGDSVLVLLQGIDKGVFDYFSAMGQESGGGPGTASPTNPPSNLTNGALGYFSACAVRSRLIVIQ